MAKFVVHNRTAAQIDVIIPATHRVTSFSLMLQPSCTLDILPFAGDLESCRRISQIADLRIRGLVTVEEVP